MEQEIKELRDLAQKYRNDAQELINQYGQGVRPSWVSTDLAIAYENAYRCDNKATKLEASMLLQGE